MDKYEEMLKRADEKYHFSELEKDKIIRLLDYCHANDVRWTLRRMFEVYFMCSAMPGMEITTCDCNDQCARYGCSNCTAADDAELLINQEKSILDFEESDEFYFKEEVKFIIKKYHGSKKEKIPTDEIEMILKEIEQELNCYNKRLK